MKTYRLQHEDSKTDVLTTDFMDIWNELELIPDGETLQITKAEMTSAEFETILKERAVLKLSIRTPWKNGSE